MTKPLFAELWNVRVEMTHSWSREGGFAPGAQRCPYAEVARALVASGFVCSYRGGLRIAPHFYNTDEEIDLFMDELVERVRKAAA